MKRIFACWVGLLVLAAVAVVADYAGCVGPGSAGPERLRGDRLAVYITGQTDGNMEPCNCPGQPWGGLSRRATVLGRLRARFGTGLLVDAGNLLALNPDAVADRYMAAGYARLAYDAIGVGDQELDRGADNFAVLAQAHDLPIVSANVAVVDGRPLGPRYRLIERSGRHVLLTAVLAEGTLRYSKPEVHAAVKLSDPAAALAEVLTEAAARLGRRPDLVIVLAALDPVDREETLARLSAADLVVALTSQDRPVELAQAGATRFVYAPNMGRQVAAVVFEFATASPPAGGAPAPETTTGATTAPADAATHPAIVHVGGTPVEQSLARDRELWELYQSYTYDQQQQTLAVLGQVGKIELAASEQCGRCHETQYRWWREQKHGQAWAAIQREGRTRDPHCMRCHTTGFGFAGGFRSEDSTPRMSDVGCQSCHQVDYSTHAAATPPKQVAKVFRSTCTACHTDAKSPAYTHAEYGPKAKCPPGKPVTPTP